MVGQTTNDIDSTLKERGSRYGAYPKQAMIAQELKEVMRNTPSWEKLGPFQKEALDMSANKIARILNGDPNYIDSWHDIIGYIKLVENTLLELEQQDHANYIAGEVNDNSLSNKVSEPLVIAYLYQFDRNSLLDAQFYCLDYAKSNKGNHVNAAVAAEKIGELIGRIDNGLARLGK